MGQYVTDPYGVTRYLYGDGGRVPKTKSGMSHFMPRNESEAQQLGGKNGRANVHEARLEDTAAGKGTERADDFTGGG